MFAQYHVAQRSFASTGVYIRNVSQAHTRDYNVNVLLDDETIYSTTFHNQPRQYNDFLKLLKKIDNKTYEEVRANERVARIDKRLKK